MFSTNNNILLRLTNNKTYDVPERGFTIKMYLFLVPLILEIAIRNFKHAVWLVTMLKWIYELVFILEGAFACFFCFWSFVYWWSSGIVIELKFMWNIRCFNNIHKKITSSKFTSIIYAICYWYICFIMYLSFFFKSTQHHSKGVR